MFSKHVAGAKCAHIIHPWTQSCSHAWRTMLVSSSIGCCKMFLPVFVVECTLKLLKKKKINMEIVAEPLRDYLQCVAVVTVMTVMFVSNNCAIRYLQGKYTYASITFFPAFVAGLPFVLFKPKLKFQTLTAISNPTLESIVLKMSQSGLLPLNMYTETIFFMITNACLMYAFKLSGSHKLSHSWFFKPDMDDQKNDDKLFMKKLFTKIRNYFGLGYGFGILRTLIGDVTVLRPKNVHKLFKISTLKAGVFASSYVAIYELTSYILYRYFRKNQSVYALPAGFLAGMSYAVDPNMSINLSSFINLMQIVYKLIDIRVLRWIPMNTLIFCLSTGTLLHFQLFYPKSISKVGSKFIKISSGKRSNIILEAMKRLNVV